MNKISGQGRRAVGMLFWLLVASVVALPSPSAYGRGRGAGADLLAAPRRVGAVPGAGWVGPVGAGISVQGPDGVLGSASTMATARCGSAMS